MSHEDSVLPYTLTSMKKFPVCHMRTVSFLTHWPAWRNSLYVTWGQCPSLHTDQHEETSCVSHEDSVLPYTLTDIRKRRTGHTRDRGWCTLARHRQPTDGGWANRTYLVIWTQRASFINFITNAFSQLACTTQSLTGTTMGQFANTVIALYNSSVISLLTQTLINTSFQQAVCLYLTIATYISFIESLMTQNCSIHQFHRELDNPKLLHTSI